jgi:hypothetical protein
MKRAALWAVPALGAVLCVISFGTTRVDPVSAYGLVGAVPPVYFAGTTLLIAGFVAVVVWQPCPWTWVASSLGAIVVALHGLPGVVDRNPRFPVAWLHVAFADHIAEHGTLLQGLDARFSWAGFFSGVGLVERVAGTSTALWLVRFAPVAANLFAAWAIVLLGRAVGIGRRESLVGAAMFVVLNWTGQDYLSPQATAFCLYLTAAVVVLTAFAGPGRPWPRWLGTVLGDAPWGEDTRAVPPVPAFVALVVIPTAIIVSHQLTPFFLAIALLLLAISGSTRIRVLGVAVLVGTTVWISFAAEPFWIGHLRELMGSVGQVRSLAEQNVTQRARSSTFPHSLAVYARIAISVAVWAAAAGAFVVARVRRRLNVPLLCLFAAPFPVALLQSYGGEMSIRIFLFSLPPAVLAISDALFRVSRPRPWLARGVAAVVLSAAVPVFLLARFGNESYERVTSDDRTVVANVVGGAPTGSEMFVLFREAAFTTGRVRDVKLRRMGATTAPDILARVDEMDQRDAYLVLTEAQAAYGEFVEGYPKGWMRDLVAELRATDRFQVVARSGASIAFRVRHAR